MNGVWSIFLIFLRLGLTSFGGPVAHLGYFRSEFVTKRQWLTDHAYGDLVSLCQFLPGPASSQVGMAIGLGRGGYGGAVAAWVGFTLPSAIIMTLFGLGLTRYGQTVPPAVLMILGLVAVFVVAKAVWGMSKKLCPDAIRKGIAIASALTVLSIPHVWGQSIAIGGGALLGWWLVKDAADAPHAPPGGRVSRLMGTIMLSLFGAGLFGLPALAVAMGDDSWLQFSHFYRAGSLVFGGGHLVLPLLQAEVVPRAWVSSEAFLAGYGAAQAVPGPLFTFAAFLGAVSTVQPSGWPGAMLCLVAIFLPSFLLVVGVMPFWETLRRHQAMQRIMRGINAAVVGLLIAALAAIVMELSRFVS